MKKYIVRIMSIDPELSDEDNHQKYCFTIEANTLVEAKQKGIENLNGLPVFWIKCFEVDQPVLDNLFN